MSSSEERFEEALETCHPAKIKKLISSGFYVNQILRGGLPPLSFALERRLFEVVELLISSGADVCQLDTTSEYCPMFFAIKNKCPHKIIKRMVLAGADINGIVEYKFRSTALHLAVYGNQKSVIKCLLSLSASIDSRDANGLTPLHVAVQANHPKIIKMLVSKGANLNVECCMKFTPLMFAIREKNYDLVDLLISLGSDVNYEPAEPKYSYQKPLNYAVGFGYIEIVHLLLKHGANTKPTAKFNESPLHSVSHSNVINDKAVIGNIIQLLLELGGDLTYNNNAGMNPLHSAIISKNTKVAKYLLKAGASVGKATEHGDTPLHLAAAVGNSTMVRLLLSSGADMGVVNIYNLSPYCLALKQNDTDTVRAFWSYGKVFEGEFESEGISDSIQKLIDEQKNFYLAIESSNHTKIIQALENGVEPKASSTVLRHPLHYLVSRNDELIIYELLERGLPVGSLDENGDTPLHVASRYGNNSICINLLAHGACYNSLSRSGKTPYQIAQANKHEYLMRLFESIGYVYQSEFKEDESEKIAKVFKSIMIENKDWIALLSKAFFNCVNRKGNTALGDALSRGLIQKAQTIMTYRLKCTNIGLM